MGRKAFGRIEIRIAVHYAVSDVFGILKSGDHAENALLLRPFESCLESDKVIHRTLPVVLS